MGVRRLRVVLALLLLASGLVPWLPVFAQENVSENATDGADGGGSGDAANGGRRALDASRLLLALSAIIALGFGGFMLFDKFRIADILFLIGFGVLLGPVFGFLDVDLFKAVQPLLGSFALLIIMFDGGLDLDFRDLATAMGWSLFFSTLGFVLTVLAVAAAAHFVLGISWLLALLLGAALGGTSGMVVLPIVGRLDVPGKVRTGLYVETFVPDVYSVTAVLVLVDIALASGIDVQGTANQILTSLSLALLVGFGVGLLWIRGLGWLGKRRYAYMVTLAAVLALSWVVEFLGGSGPLAVLAFGLVLANRRAFGSWGRVERPRVFKELQQFNNEVAFLVRSFFFVFLGLILDLSIFTPRFLVVSLLLLGALVAARFLAVWITTGHEEQLRKHRGLIFAMLPRGLTAAVLVTLPATVGIRGTENFPAYAVVIVVLTNVVLTLGVYLFFRAARGDGETEGEEHAQAS